MCRLSSSQKGAAAEAEVIAALIRMNHLVLKPLVEGGRYDLAVDLGSYMLRVQCKWASRRGDVLSARCATSRHTPGGYRRRTYRASEIDAIAVYSQAVDQCFLVPISEIEGYSMISLRIGPTRNRQASGVRWAKDYELARRLPPAGGSSADRAQAADGKILSLGL